MDRFANRQWEYVGCPVSVTLFCYLGKVFGRLKQFQALEWKALCLKAPDYFANLSCIPECGLLPPTSMANILPLSLWHPHSFLSCWIPIFVFEIYSATSVSTQSTYYPLISGSLWSENVYPHLWYCLTHCSLHGAMSTCRLSWAHCTVHFVGTNPGFPMFFTTAFICRGCRQHFVSSRHFKLLLFCEVGDCGLLLTRPLCTPSGLIIT